jgi:capsular exopolysaccharide synthesis family protein
MNDLDPQRDYRHGVSALELGEDHEAFQPAARTAFDFRYLAASIRANLVLILGIVLLALALAVIATLLDTPRYTAASTIQINDASSRVIGERDDQNAEINNTYDIDRFLKTQTDVLRSRGLAIRVAQKLKLFGNADFYRAMEAGAPGKGASEEAMRNLTLGLLRSNLDVALPRDSRIVTISFNSADQKVASDVANAFAGEFIQSNLQRKYDSTAYARDFVGAQLADAKLKLETSERELNDYARGAGIIRTRDAADTEGNTRSYGGGSVTTASLLQLNAAANDARAARIAAEGRWQAVSGAPLLASREVLSNPTVISLANQRAALEADLQNDLTRHLEDYPSIRQKRAELTKLNSELQSAAAAVRASLRSEYETALTTENRLNAQVRSLKGETLSEQDRSVRYAILEREADTNRELYDGLLQRFKELTSTAGISASNVSIVDQAELPQAPSSPNLIKNLLIALIAGVGLAGLALFLKDQLDDAIRVPEDIEHKLRLPLLGVVPKVGDRDPDGALADPKSPVSEAYNSLRGALLYSTSHGLPQVMLVTSAQPAEGKTTTSYALAAGFARMGRKVLLVDADLRRPSVHRRLGSNNEKGLTTLLTGNETLAGLIEQSAQPSLFMLTSGPVPPSPTELLSSTRMEQLVEEMARTYDVVLIDSPPILGLADAPVLSALADGVIFVVESDRSRRGSLKMALRRLRAMRPVLLGAVLSKFDPTREGNRYSEYYGYHYYQYDHREPDPA